MTMPSSGRNNPEDSYHCTRSRENLTSQLHFNMALPLHQCFPVRIVYAFLISPKRAKYFGNRIDLVTVEL